MELWASESTDERLCELVTRLSRAGYRHTLEVKFPFEDRLCKDDLAKLFPRI